MRGFVSFILELLFPARCVVCGEKIDGWRSSAVIPAGWPEGTINYLFYSDSYFIDTHTVSPEKVVCRHCLFNLEPAGKLYSVLQGWDKGGKELHIISPFYINDTLLAIIHALKFSGITVVSSFLTWWMYLSLSSYINSGGIGVEDLVIVPVPLHRSRKRERGYNQSELIARGIAGMFGIGISEATLVRKKRTKKQSKLSHAERIDNVKGAFELADVACVEGKIPVLVDDLVTTGSTVLSCAEAFSALDLPLIIVICAGRSRAL